jgi:hypothetical protein
VDRSARWPTEAEIAEINSRHLIETELKPADLLFVFGTREDVGGRVDEACRLWREGLFRWSIVSGGVTPGSTRSECETWTARRYPMTLHRHWPDVEKMLVTIDGFATPRALWHTDPEFRRRMLREWDKIEPYRAKGFIADWPVR